MNAFNKDFNFINSPKDDGVFEFFTDLGTRMFKSVQCCHCGIHDQYIKGSGKRRGYCMKCRHITCDKELCIKECVPYEAQIEIQEGNKRTILKYSSTETCKRLLDMMLQNKFGNVPIIGK